MDAEQCFTKLPSTDISLQIAVYYYSLQLASRLQPGTNSEDTATLSSMYCTSPASLCAAVVTYISRALRDPVVGARMSSSIHQMVQRLMHYNSRLIELSQAQALRSLSTGQYHVLLHALCCRRQTVCSMYSQTRSSG